MLDELKLVLDDEEECVVLGGDELEEYCQEEFVSEGGWDSAVAIREGVCKAPGREIQGLTVSARFPN